MRGLKLSWLRVLPQSACSLQAWKRALDAVASASLDDLLDDFAGSDPALTAIVERSKVLTQLNTACALLQSVLCRPFSASRCLCTMGVLLTRCSRRALAPPPIRCIRQVASVHPL